MHAVGRAWINQSTRFTRDIETEKVRVDLGVRPGVGFLLRKIGRYHIVDLQRRRPSMTVAPLRVACIGMGWWSDVLADAIQRSGKLEIAACYTRSPHKRAAFAAKYGCPP